MKRCIPNLSVWLLLSLLLTACAQGKDPSLGECDLEACPDKCLALEGSTCDVRRPSCQKRIFAAVSCVRGAGGQLPEIRTLTEDQLRDEQAEDAGIDAGSDTMLDADVDGGGGALEPEPPDPIVYWDTALRLLGLRFPETSTDSVDYLGGYYSPADERITLIDRGAPQDSPYSQRLLAHELVHGLQDQQIGFTELGRSTGRTTDARLARGCLEEGEAELYEDLAWTLLQGLSIDQTYWAVTFERNFKYDRDAVLAAESPFEQLWLLRYAVGARYLADAWLAAGNWGVQSLYEAPPVSTVYWMHGFADSQEREQPLTQTLACNSATRVKGFEQQWGDTLGAFGVFAFLGHNLTDRGVYKTEESWQRALAWRQDRFEVFSGPKGETALSWRIRFDSREVAHDVAEELRDHDALNLRVKQHGEEIELFTSDSRAAIKAWRGTDPEHCPVYE